MNHPLGRKLRDSYQNFDEEGSLVINCILPWGKALVGGMLSLVRFFRAERNE